MSQFDTDFAEAGRPLLLEQLGDPITYTPPGGDPVSIELAIVGADEADEADEFDGRRKRRTRMVTGSVADVARPLLSGTFEIDSETWAVESVEACGATMWRVRVVRTGSIEKTRRGYRQR